jgi:hypothetical protein
VILTHVERRLMHYCPPPAHQWQPVPGASGLESCATCQRTRPLGSPACLLCDNDGIQTFRLENQPSGQHTNGHLCARCQAEFAYRGSILGWTAAPSP